MTRICLLLHCPDQNVSNRSSRPRVPQPSSLDRALGRNPLWAWAPSTLTKFFWDAAFNLSMLQKIPFLARWVWMRHTSRRMVARGTFFGHLRSSGDVCPLLHPTCCWKVLSHFPWRRFGFDKMTQFWSFRENVTSWLSCLDNPMEGTAP
jgi:hypothetical protein